MVKHTPITMLGMVVAFSLTALIAIVPMGVLLVMQHDAPQSGQMTSSAPGPLVVIALAAVLVSIATASVTWGTRRRLRPAGA